MNRRNFLTNSAQFTAVELLADRTTRAYSETTTSSMDSNYFQKHRRVGTLHNSRVVYVQKWARASGGFLTVSPSMAFSTAEHSNGGCIIDAVLRQIL
jgi:hypothetical protein